MFSYRAMDLLQAEVLKEHFMMCGPKDQLARRMCSWQPTNLLRVLLCFVTCLCSAVMFDTTVQNQGECWKWDSVSVCYLCICLSVCHLWVCPTRAHACVTNFCRVTLPCDMLLWASFLVLAAVICCVKHVCCVSPFLSFFRSHFISLLIPSFSYQIYHPF